MQYDAIVIGGGLAGCSAALQLARDNHEVLLLEKSSYPRHKLCGEFLSPEAQSSLRRLGVLNRVQGQGAASIRSARLTGPNGTETTHPLPGTALGLSRYRLDALLFHHACENGVDGHAGTRVTEVDGSNERGFSVKAGGQMFEGRLVLGAYGRRSVLDRTLSRPFLDESSPYVAFKSHYTGPPSALPSHHIELHATTEGYCGVGPIEEGRACICWIGTTEALNQAGGRPATMLRDILQKNPSLDDRLRPLTRVHEDFEAVSQVPLMSKDLFANDVCMIGDAAGMIAPLCGDGMAMALASADLVAPLASEVLGDRRSFSSFRSAYTRTWKNSFARRMRIGRWVHASAFRPAATTAVLLACRFFPPLGRWLIRATRN